MDTYLEHMIKQKSTPKTSAMKALLIVGTIVLEIVMVMLMLSFPGLSFFIFLVMAGAIYGAWFLMRNFRVEYEYIVTNGEMDVDKIISQQKRKRVATVDFRRMEIMAPMGGAHKNEFENQSIEKMIDASVSTVEKGAYFVVTRTEKLGRFKLVFTPDERILKSAKLAAPRKVFTD